MLISIHDKTLRRVAFIDNEKPETLHFFDDVWHRYLTEATSTFDFSVPKTGNAAHRYLTEKNYVSFRYGGQDYLFNIMRTEETETELACYCENLSMELLNEISPAFKSGEAQTFEWYFNNSDLVGGQNFSDLVLGINEVSDYSRSLEWEGTDTKLARLLSLVNKFDAECEFVTELNRDGTLKRIVLNVYKANDEEHQGVGTRRQNVTLYYGKSIDGIRRTVDKTELYSAIYPLGKDGLNISALDKTEYDADGNVLYYTHAGQPFIYAPQTAEDYPAQVSTNDDPWILYRWDYETENVNVLYGQALARLKKISQPAITYEVEGAFELNIGDTVTIHDDKFTPTLLLEARVSEQEVSFCDPTKNRNVFSNFKALENKLSTDITERLEELIQNAKPYTLEILSDNGIVFKNGTGTTTLTARVMRGGTDVTDRLALQWTERGVNIATRPSLTVTADQVPEKTVFRAAAKSADGSELCFAEVTLINVLDGDDGIGIDRVDLEYCQTTSPVTAPEGPWTETAPVWAEGKHIWQRTVVRYSDGTEKATKPVCITGDKGAAGVSATEIVEEYYLSTSNKILLGGAWSETCPAWEKGKYIWTRSRCSWSDGTTTYTTPVFAGGLNSANDKADAAMGAVDAVEIKVNRLEAENVTIYGKLTASEAEINDLKAQDVTISGKLEAAQGNIETLTAGQVTITGKLTAAEADIEKLTVDQATITGKLTVAEADIVKLKADVAEVGDLSAITADIGKLKADVADIDLAMIGKADIDLANIKNGCITTAMIGTGVIGTTQIADGSITDAKIVGLTANKITAGRLDAAQIEVVNLNAANITVGTINGVQIATGAIDLDKLSGTVSGMINGAVNTANNAQTTADGKNKIYYQNTQPGLTGNKKGDTWFDTANGYRAYVWNGTAWSLSPFGSAAIADDAVTLAKVGADLQSFMDDINSKALAAQTSADGKNTVFYQATQPPTTGRKTGDTWYNTAKDNAISKWDGSKWTEITFGAGAISDSIISADKLSTDIVNQLNTAASDAATAKATADTAKTNAATAQSAADAAKATLAAWCYNNNLTYIDGGDIYTGTVTAAKIAAGAITTEKLAANAVTAAKITAGTITGDKIAGKTISADKIVAGTITANSGVIANGAILSAMIGDAQIGTAKIANLAVTGAKIANATITNAQIADATIQSAKIAALDAGKITTGILAAARIAAGSITADKLASKSITVGQISDGVQALIAAPISMINGNLVYHDPTFASGANAVGLYNNSSNGLVTVTRISKPSDCPTKSGYCMQIKTTGSASPGLGGFVQSIASRANAVFIVKYLIKLPIGYSLVVASNSMGSGYKDEWLTSTAGTGKWTEYVRKVTCGASGTFSNGGHVYVTGSPPTASVPFVWYLGAIYLYDVTDSSYLDSTMASWCYNNDMTYINGGKIYTGSIAAAQIAANAIVAGKIAANAVTTATIAAGAINADKLAANSVNASKIVAGSITAAQLAANTITGDKIAATTIAAGNLAANAVTSDKIVAGAVTSGKIAAKSITANEMAAGSITASNAALADACIVTAKIADGAITNAKIANATIQSAKIAALDAAKITSGYIAAARIQAKSLTADKFNVSTLSAITANLGTVTAGVIKSANYAAGSAGMQLTLSNGTWDSPNFKIASDGKVDMSGNLTIKDSYSEIKFVNSSNKEFATLYASSSVSGSNISNSISFSIGSGILTLKSVSFNSGASYIPTINTYCDFHVQGEIYSGPSGSKSLLDRTYPVGSIYMSVNSTSPATLFGGTWVELQGRFLLGRSSSYANGSTGGAPTESLSVAQMPAHKHNLSYGVNTNSPGNMVTIMAGAPEYFSSNPIGNNGSGSAHNNMPPYLAVYMWKRTA